MRALIALRLECLRMAGADVAKAKQLEAFVRRGITRKEMQDQGCGGCSGKASGKLTGTPPDRHSLLHSSAPAVTGVRMQDMTVLTLVSDADLVFSQTDADRVDAALARHGLRRGMTAAQLNVWVAKGSSHD